MQTLTQPIIIIIGALKKPPLRAIVTFRRCNDDRYGQFSANLSRLCGVDFAGLIGIFIERGLLKFLWGFLGARWACLVAVCLYVNHL